MFAAKKYGKPNSQVFDIPSISIEKLGLTVRKTRFFVPVIEILGFSIR